jgi:tetratricopeptide (TPR) repeat protein
MVGFLRRSGSRQPGGRAQADEDEAFLSAEPISRERMDLLWCDPPRLAQIERWVSGESSIIVTMGDATQLRDDEITPADVVWAKQVEKVVDIAFAASERRDFVTAIASYKKALDLAPGCDLFLMSIGTGYAYLGQKARALRYLERAAAISPGNTRIQENLVQARRL